MIDTITAEKIYQAFKKLLNTKATLLALGGNIADIETLHNIKGAFK